MARRTVAVSYTHLDVYKRQAQVDDLPTGLEKQLPAIGMGGQTATVTGQRKTHRLGQAVHRVGGKHA